MPIYEYACAGCGRFSRLAKLSESASPAPCPECGCESPRIISAPALSIMSGDNRSRWERNEKAAHEPRRIQRACGCTGTHRCGTENRTGGSAHDPTRPTKLQRQARKNARPWMLGH